MDCIKCVGETVVLLEWLQEVTERSYEDLGNILSSLTTGLKCNCVKL